MGEGQAGAAVIRLFFRSGADGMPGFRPWLRVALYVGVVTDYAALELLGCVNG